MTACTELLVTVVKGHYLSVACNILGISTFEDIPAGLPDAKSVTPQVKRAYIFDIASKVVEQCSVISSWTS